MTDCLIKRTSSSLWSRGATTPSKRSFAAKVIIGFLALFLTLEAYGFGCRIESVPDDDARMLNAKRLGVKLWDKLDELSAYFENQGKVFDMIMIARSGLQMSFDFDLLNYSANIDGRHVDETNLNLLMSYILGDGQGPRGRTTRPHRLAAFRSDRELIFTHMGFALRNKEAIVPWSVLHLLHSCRDDLNEARLWKEQMGNFFLFEDTDRDYAAQIMVPKQGFQKVFRQMVNEYESFRTFYEENYNLAALPFHYDTHFRNKDRFFNDEDQNSNLWPLEMTALAVMLDWLEKRPNERWQHYTDWQNQALVKSYNELVEHYRSEMHKFGSFKKLLIEKPSRYMAQNILFHTEYRPELVRVGNFMQIGQYFMKLFTDLANLERHPYAPWGYFQIVTTDSVLRYLQKMGRIDRVVEVRLDSNEVVEGDD